MNLIEQSKLGEELWVTHRKIKEIQISLADRIGNIAKEQAELRAERLIMLEKWRQVVNLRMGVLQKIEDSLQQWDAVDEQELALIKQYKEDIDYKKMSIQWNLERLEGGRSPRIRFNGTVVTRQEAQQSIQEADQLLRDWFEAFKAQVDAVTPVEEISFEVEPVEDEQEPALVE